MKIHLGELQPFTMIFLHITTFSLSIFFLSSNYGCACETTCHIDNPRVMIGRRAHQERHFKSTESRVTGVLPPNLPFCLPDVG